MRSGSNGRAAVAWRQAGDEDPLAAGQVAEAAGEQQQAGERDQVRVDHPGQTGL
jgi:hypothetical protein